MRVASGSIALRPASAGDEAFLRDVYASTRTDELALVDWTDEQKDDFVQQQFDAQDAHYHAHYTGATYDVIEVGGRPAGRLYVDRWDEEIRIMDIALLPEHRGAGIGTTLLSALLEEGAKDGKRVSIHVEKHNPARRLYERLGFAETADRGVYVLMEATP
jgi:ribosomal protein S18 acetylase RimI-like enzyme